jgi:hypothetical protein
MSLFGFGNISFNKQNSPTKGPLRALEGSDFDTTTLRYPADVGNYDKGHYMVFYIREQKDSAFAQNAGIADTAIDNLSMRTFEDVASPQNMATNFGSEILGKINSGLNSINSAVGGVLGGQLSGAVSSVTGAIGSAAGGIVGGINNLFGQKASILTGDAGATSAIIEQNVKKISNNSFIKTTQLTKDAIALYMPDTLMYTHQQSYDQASMGGELAGQVLAAGKSALKDFQEKGALDAAMTALKAGGLGAAQAGITTAGGLLGSPNTARVAGAALLGAVTNPMLELIYSSPNFRTFQFDFTFYPRDEKEAFEVQQILERFRFHQAPEFRKETQGFLIPPSQFDIRFYYGGRQNPNIPSIATCVLTSIDINYAPNGFSAYEIPGESSPALGRTGMPVAIQMNLQFQEVTYLTKADFNSEQPSVSQKYTQASQSGQYGSH